MSEDSFKTIASKDIYTLLHFVLMLCFICMDTCCSCYNCLGGGVEGGGGGSLVS